MPHTIQLIYILSFEVYFTGKSKMEKIVLQILLLSSCWLIDEIHCEMSTLNDITTLIEDVTTNYDKRVRPVHNQLDFIVVNMNFRLIMIRSFDDVSGEITLLRRFVMEWIEERIKWNSLDYGNITEIILPKDDVWHLNLFMETSLNTQHQPGTAASRVSIGSDGKASMASTDLITSICPADLTNYPNDHQTCTLTITPSGYSIKQMRLGKSSTVTHNVLNNNQWEILDVISDAETGEFEIEISLKRISTYATMTMTVPIHLLGALNPWVFFLPPVSGLHIPQQHSLLSQFTWEF